MIKIHRIFAGFSVVEFEGTDFSLMAGCPPDAAKYLIRDGFIRTVKIDGRDQAVGPAAMLLNDCGLQNGDCNNFSEFPILHMLFAQGMIRGEDPRELRPKLIGKAEIVDSQMEYLSWGIYGTVDEAELKSLGLGGEFLENFLNQKLFFASGKFHRVDTLVDRCVLEDSTLLIHPELELTRVGENLFKIGYRGCAELIDLNRKETEEFPPIITHDRINLPDAKFAVVNTGCGDGWDPHRLSFGSLIRHDGRNFLVDAGPNIVAHLKCFGLGVEDLSGVFLTHVHDDHFAGLVGLAANSKRVQLISTRLVHFSAKKKFEALTMGKMGKYEENFEIAEIEYDRQHDFGGLEVFGYHCPHSIENAMFYFRVWEEGASKYRSYAHFCDLCSFSGLERMCAGDYGVSISKNFLEKIKRNCLKPADLKKIDVGGGMVHGEASDFAGDPSKKLVLGHTSCALSREQLKIGQSEYFGESNVLIP